MLPFHVFHGLLLLGMVQDNGDPLRTSPTGLSEGSDVSSLSLALALCEILFHCKDVLEVSSMLLLHPHLHSMYHLALTLYREEFTVSLNKCSVRFSLDSSTMGKILPMQNYEEKQSRSMRATNCSQKTCNPKC